MDIQTLFENYHDEIFRYLWRLCHDSLLAQDLTQETFLKAFRGLAKLSPESNYRAWLYRIATHTQYDEWRKQQRQPIAEMDLEWLSASDNLERDYEQQELIRQLWEHVAQLPAKQQQVLILSRYQQLEHHEIAEILKMSSDSVRANLYQALKKLRQIFEEV